MLQSRFSLDCVPTLSSASLVLVIAGLGTLGCSPKQVPPPEDPVPSLTPSEPTASEGIAPLAPAGSADEREPAPTPAPAAAKEPEFRPGMSVTEAIDAAQGTDRVEIEQEVLAEPIVKPELYEPCKLRSNQHFKLRVAIWDGRVVGMDLTATPKNPSAEECIRNQVQGVTWKKKAKALSTFEFNF